MHDAVFDHPTTETAARTKLNSILKPNEVVEILKCAVDDADGKWIDALWEIPTMQIWGKTFHKYEGMTDILSVRMMEEFV